MFHYCLIINNEAKGKPYFFQYGNTKNIELVLLRDSACIRKSFNKDYRNNLKPDSYLFNLFKEGMKRISLLHILYYQKQIKVKSTQLRVTGPGGVEEIYDLTNYFILYSLTSSGLLRSISKEWRNQDVLQNVLRFQKSKTDLARSTAALYAYLYSKTKSYETERFSFLWMAMNGLYGAMKPEVSSDRSQMSNLIQVFHLGSAALTKETRDEICQLVYIKMKDIEGKVTEGSLGGEHKELAEYISRNIPIDKQTKKPFDLSPYGFLLTDFPYYLRCKLFHANRPVELFSFSDDLEIKVLRIVNGLLEEFLDDNLIRIFSD